ncbi:Chlorophyll a-b binding protein CP24 10A, chloroplastic, partial [Turnera subulata]
MILPGSIQSHSLDLPPSLSFPPQVSIITTQNSCLLLRTKIPTKNLAHKQRTLFAPREGNTERSMAATSAAVVNGLGSSFLRGGNRSQALLSSGVPRVGASGTRRFVVVAAATAQKKSWIPAVKGGGNFIDPEWLDGSLPGDYGFDPLGLGRDPAFLKWYREAELIHGRWAMAAVVGIFVGQAWSGIPWFEAGADPGAIAPFSFGSLLGTQLILMGWVESKRWKLERLKVAEIKHARLAMVAMLIFYFEAGQGKTPLGAL